MHQINSNLPPSPHKKRGSWISLKVKLPVTVFISVFLILGGVTVLIVNKTTTILSYVETQLIEESALSLRNRITAELQRASKDMILLSTLPMVLQGVELSPRSEQVANEKTQRLALINSLNRAKLAYSYYDALWLMDIKGELLAGVFEKSNARYIKPDQTILSAVLSKNTVIIANSILDPSTNELLQPVYLKIIYNGQVGILAGTVQIARMARQALSELRRPHINTFIMNVHGEVIASPTQKLTQVLNRGDTTWFTDVPKTFAGNMSITLLNDKKNVVYRHIPQTKLYAVVMADSAYMRPYVESIQRITLIICSLAALFLLVCVYLFLLPLTRDIKQLSLFAKKIGQHQETTPLTISRNDELGDLAYTLTEMVSTLTNLLVRTEAATKTKSDFLAHMSHEIRTPMNAIIGMTYLALQNNPDVKQVHFLHRIDTAANNLLTIINDILDFSKLEAHKMHLNKSTFSLITLLHTIQELLEIRASEKKLTLLCTLAHDVPHFIQSDKVRLSQVCINLISNAIKFTDKGTVKLHISIYRKEDNDIYLLFSIKDTGIGIAPEAQQQIFDSFSQADNSSTRNYEGTGLGLAISKSLITLFDGNIWLESELGKGSSFYFTLRTQEGTAEEILPQSFVNATEETLILENIHILLAEDNLVNQEIALELLSSMGATITIANNGAEAVELWEEPNTFDMILMDIQMPVMDGLTAVKMIRASSKSCAQDIPIIAITANALSGDKEKSLLAGMNDHITKPFNLQELQTTLTYWASFTKIKREE